METLIAFTRLETAALLGGLILGVIYQLLTGKINLNGLLNDSQTGVFSPARLQLLLFTLAGAFYYVYSAAQSPGQLPEVPAGLLLLLGGSHLVYLGSKALAKGG